MTQRSQTLKAKTEETQKKLEEASKKEAALKTTVAKSETDLKQAKDLNSKMSGKLGLEAKKQQYQLTQEEKQKLGQEQQSFLTT